MLVYAYNSIDNTYIGEYALNDGDRNPLQPDEYLIPAGCTATAPRESQAGFIQVWVEGMWSMWIQVEDHRGEVWYDEAGKKVVITEIGSPPASLTQTKPPAPLPDLAKVKTDAKALTISFANTITAEIESSWTNAEIRSWPTREAEVVAYHANQSPDSAPLLSASANERGIPLPDYVNIVAAYANAYKAITVAMEKYRVSAWKDIDMAIDAEQVAAVIDAAKASLMAQISAIQAGGA